MTAEITGDPLPQLEWTAEMIEELRTKAWDAVCNRERNTLTIEHLINQIEDVLERKLVSGNQVLVWRERVSELHQLNSDVAGARWLV